MTEQGLARKRLTIGVELAAKPQLLLFLDEVGHLFNKMKTSVLTQGTAYFWTRWAKRLESRPFLKEIS